MSDDKTNDKSSKKVVDVMAEVTVLEGDYQAHSSGVCRVESWAEHERLWCECNCDYGVPWAMALDSSGSLYTNMFQGH